MWRRYLRLPEPTSVAGWFADTIFYLYSVVGVLYFLLGGFWLQLRAAGRQDDDIPLYVLFLGAAASLAIAAASRRWSLSIARNKALMDDAKVIVATTQAPKATDHATNV